MLRVNVIGPGKVGRTILSLIGNRSEIEVGDVLGGHPQNARRAVASLGVGRAVDRLQDMRPADLWFLTVPDDAVSGVARDLAEAHCDEEQDPDAARPIAVHCSGFLSSEALSPLRDVGWLAASCHPVLSFADPEIAARQFPGTFCGIEGDAAAVDRIAACVAGLGGRPFTISAEKKALYHAAAVFSNNFAVVLQAIALEAWAESGVADDVARDLCSALLRATAENVAQKGPAAALTGPAARGDQDVVRNQQIVVQDWHQEAAEVYRVLSRLADRLKRSGSTLPLSGESS